MGAASSKRPKSACTLRSRGFAMPLLTFSLTAIDRLCHRPDVTPDLFSPNRHSLVSQDLPLRRTADATDPQRHAAADADPGRRASATSRGSDRSRPTVFLPPTAPRHRATTRSSGSARSRSISRAQAEESRRRDPAAGAAAATAAAVRLSIPPSETASKPPLPPAMAGTIVGQPPRRRLKLDDDPFGAVGDLRRLSGQDRGRGDGVGYDTNPGRLNSPQGKAFYMVAPEFVAMSDWRATPSSPICAAPSPATATSQLTPIDGTPSRRRRSMSTVRTSPGMIDGRLDVSRGTRI